MKQSFATLLWESDGKPVKWKDKTVMMYHRVQLPGDKSRLKYRILSATSVWKEGLAIRTDGSLEFDDGQTYGKNWVVIWWEGEPIEQEFICESKEKRLDVKNVWDTGNGCIDSWVNNAAMWAEEIDGGFRYHCNDGRYDEDFDDIIFEILILD